MHVIPETTIECPCCKNELNISFNPISTNDPEYPEVVLSVVTHEEGEKQLSMGIHFLAGEAIKHQMDTIVIT